jgi:hypothetical protein
LLTRLRRLLLGGAVDATASGADWIHVQAYDVAAGVELLKQPLCRRVRRVIAKLGGDHAAIANVIVDITSVRLSGGCDRCGPQPA